MNTVPAAPPAGELPILKPKREFGALRGQISLGPEFFEPLPEEELALWEVAATSRVTLSVGEALSIPIFPANAGTQIVRRAA
jgi:hypothetical protein